MVPSTLDVEPSILDKKIDSNIKGRFPESRGLRASVSSSVERSFLNPNWYLNRIKALNCSCASTPFQVSIRVISFHEFLSCFVSLFFSGLEILICFSKILAI